jgi:hypothetical protein
MRFLPATGVAILLLASSLPAQNFPERPASALAFFHNIEQEAAVGSNGKDFLVVGFRGGMVAHRVTEAGEVLDGTGIRIPLPREAINISFLGVFWTGDAYTILWRMQIQQMIPGSAGIVTYLARIDADGRLIVPSRLLIADRIFFSAASNGSRIVLGGGRVAVLDSQGNLIESGVQVPGDAQEISAYRVAWNGTGFMVTWFSSLGQRYLNVAPLDANGRPTGTFRKIPVALPGDPEIASDGTDYVVVYKDRDHGIDYSQHVSASGEFLENHALPGSLQEQRSIVWNGSAYLVAAPTELPAPEQLPSVLRLDRTGAAIDPAPVSISSTGTPGYAAKMLMASNGRQVLISWPEGEPLAGFRAFGALLGADGKPARVFPLGVTPTIQTSPQIARSNRNFVVVWEEGSAVYASRVSFAGQPLDGRGIKLSTKPGRAPRVVYDGQTYVIAWWIPNASIVTAHLSPDGTVLQASERPVLNSPFGEFDLTTDGNDAFVVASDGSELRVMGTRVHRDGIAEPPIAISPAKMAVADPRVSWNGAQFLVVWRQLIEVPTSSQYRSFRGNILAARVSPSMVVLDPAPLSIAVSDSEDAASPLVASNGSEVMVAWTASGAIRARTVKSNGALGATIPKIAAGFVITSLVWDGRQYTVAYLAFSAVSFTSDVFFARVRDAGSPGEGSVIAATADNEAAAVLAPIGDGLLVAAYEREASEAPYGGIRRVFVKTLPPPRSRVVR